PALRVQRLGRSNDAVDPFGIRRSEYLLGREVRHVPNTVYRLLPAADPARGRKQSDRQVRSRAFEPKGVEPPLRQAPGDALQSFVPLLPGRFGLAFVEAADVHDLLPELVERRLRLELRMHELGPLLRG